MGAVIFTALVAGLIIFGLVVGSFICDEMSADPNHHHQFH